MATTTTTTTTTTVWASPSYAVLSDGSYAELYSPGWEGNPSRPANDWLIGRARRARQLGMTVPEVIPEYKPARDIASGGDEAAVRETLASIRASIRFARIEAKKVVGWESHHDAYCNCGGCPSSPVYGEETKPKPGFAWDIALIPPTWIDGGAIRVQTDDGRMAWSIPAPHTSCGTLADAPTCERLGAPPEVAEFVRRCHAGWYARWQRKKDADEAKERAELAAIFSARRG